MNAMEDIHGAPSGGASRAEGHPKKVWAHNLTKLDFGICLVLERESEEIVLPDVR